MASADVAKLPKILWIGPDAPADTSKLPENQARQVLGTEHDVVIYNSWLSFDCDVFAAISGTVRAGGILLLLTPPPANWPEGDKIQKERVAVHGLQLRARSRFLERFCQQLLDTCHDVANPGKNTRLRLLNTADNQIAIGQTRNVSLQPNHQPQLNSEARQQQSRLIGEIVSKLGSAQQGCWIVTADRGRGKSAMLGLLAARLICRHTIENDLRINPDKESRTEHPGITLTAPSKHSVKILREFFQAAVEQESQDIGHLNCLEFIPPDILLQKADKTAVLLIDEAAAIPQPVLQSLVSSFPKVVLATTVQGYEGAGRGFAIKFLSFLQQTNITATHYELQLPMRWGAEDPLEDFVNNSLLLNTDIKLPSTAAPERGKKQISQTGFTPDELRLQEITQAELQQNEPLLRQLFAILIQAHYQTKPLDLRHILDGNNLRIFAGWQQQSVVAAALVAFEGPLENQALRQQIVKKERRPRGHLTPQLLSQWLLRESVLELQFARIVRIAVHPLYQRLGIGSSMLDQLCSELQSDNRPGNTGNNLYQQPDACCAMFGDHRDLVNFWNKNGFKQVHTSYRRNNSSGRHSTTFVKAFSSAAQTVQRDAEELFVDNFKHETGNTLPDDNDENSVRHGIDHWKKIDKNIIDAFTNGQRSLADSQSSIVRVCIQLLGSAPASMSTLPADADKAFTMQLLKLCSKRPISASLLADALDIEGKKRATELLRDTLRQLS